jgi:hypothetical protein|tara:strand:- start:474 stop:857 length:384 start_codon:yes stop_codon:yes gene_type:complete
MKPTKYRFSDQNHGDILSQGTNHRPFYKSLGKPRPNNPDVTLYVHGEAERLMGFDIPTWVDDPPCGTGVYIGQMLLPQLAEPVPCHIIIWPSPKEWNPNKKMGYIVKYNDISGIDQAMEMYNSAKRL